MLYDVQAEERELCSFYTLSYNDGLRFDASELPTKAVFIGNVLSTSGGDASARGIIN